MKKIVLLIVVLLCISLLFAACTPRYTWEDAEKDFERLKEAGFEIYIENTEEEVEYHNDVVNRQIEREGANFTVEYVRVCGLVINKYDIIVFEEFKTEKQAKNIYEHWISAESQMKYVRFGKIVIGANAQEAIDILNYDFK